MKAYLVSVFFVFLGGGLGSMVRYVISLLLDKFEFVPLDTFSANLLSCILLGWLYSSVEHTGDTSTALFWMIGFCGGFSTFSTFTMDHIRLFEAERYGLALTYIMLSFALCALGFLIGFWLHQKTG